MNNFFSSLPVKGVTDPAFLRASGDDGQPGEEMNFYRRYFQVAGITVCLESDLDFDLIKFKDELTAFAVDGPGRDNILLRHCFEMPGLSELDLGCEVYRRPPWAIYIKNGVWCYKGILPEGGDDKIFRLAFFRADHTQGLIYSHAWEKEFIMANEWQSLSLFPTDQIWLGPLMAHRSSVLLHSAAAVFKGRGLAFVGHSDAGKSTIMEILKTWEVGRSSRVKKKDQQGRQVEILCDDRNIVRKWSQGWRVHGTWSHGDIADVSANSAFLDAILFLEHSGQNKVVRITDPRLIWPRILPTVIRPMVTAQWWNRQLDTLETLVHEVPCYNMFFDRSGAIIPELERLIS